MSKAQSIISSIVAPQEAIEDEEYNTGLHYIELMILNLKDLIYIYIIDTIE